MWFQWVLKGIPGLDDADAEAMLTRHGLICRWWLDVGKITPEQVVDKLTDANLRAHLDAYATVQDTTPFISLTAGVRMRAAGPRGYGRNYVRKAQRIALQYATSGFSAPGHIFEGYVMVLPKPAVRFQEFAEDVRDLTVHPGLPAVPWPGRGDGEDHRAFAAALAGREVGAGRWPLGEDKRVDEPALRRS